MNWYVIKTRNSHLIHTASETPDGCIQRFAKTKVRDLQNVSRTTAEAIFNEYAKQAGYRIAKMEITPSEPYPEEREQSIEDLLPEAAQIAAASRDILIDPTNIQLSSKF